MGPNTKITWQDKVISVEPYSKLVRPALYISIPVVGFVLFVVGFFFLVILLDERWELMFLMLLVPFALFFINWTVLEPGKVTYRNIFRKKVFTFENVIRVDYRWENANPGGIIPASNHVPYIELRGGKLFQMHHLSNYDEAQTKARVEEINRALNSQGEFMTGSANSVSFD